MKLDKVGERGFLVTVKNPFFINSYIIEGKSRIYVLDTLCGPEQMDALKDAVQDRGIKNKEFVIFNSHKDWDHIWGNCAFSESLIISHSKCRDAIHSDGMTELKKNSQYQRGEVSIVLPNLTFDEKLTFDEDDIEFFYTPGHQPGCASVLDRKDRVLFVGDNIESPFPYINRPNFDEYIASLKSYLELDFAIMIAGHDPILKDDSLVRENIDYLSMAKEWRIDFDELSKQGKSVHSTNMVNLIDYLDWNSLASDIQEQYITIEAFFKQFDSHPFITIKLEKLKKFRGKKK